MQVKNKMEKQKIQNFKRNREKNKKREKEQMEMERNFLFIIFTVYHQQLKFVCFPLSNGREKITTRTGNTQSTHNQVQNYKNHVSYVF